MQQEINVTIVGGDHYNTYGIVRSLGAKGLKSNVVVLGTEVSKSFVLKSKYVKRGDCFLKASDSINTIIQYADTQNNILICCSDEAEELAIANHGRLKDKYILPVSADVEHMRFLMSKSYISKLAEECGICIPKTWTIANRYIPATIEFPCITKPETSTSGRKSDIVVCHDVQELEQIVKDSHRCANYAVQQYIDYEKEVSILGAVLADGSVVFSGCIDKIRTCMIGTSSFARMEDNSILGDTKNRLEILLKKTNYRGLFSAEFLLKKGVYYFLEVNFRNDGNTYVATAAGINLPYLWINSYFHITREMDQQGKYPCYFMLDIEDFLAIRRNGISLSEWFRNLHTANACLVYDKLDKKPFYKKLSNVILTIAKSKLSLKPKQL